MTEIVDSKSFQQQCCRYRDLDVQVRPCKGAVAGRVCVPASGMWRLKRDLWGPRFHHLPPVMLIRPQVIRPRPENSRPRTFRTAQGQAKAKTIHFQGQAKDKATLLAATVLNQIKTSDVTYCRASQLFSNWKLHNVQ